MSEKYMYLPQMIVAYDGARDDEFANLIHVTKASEGVDYYCPCCNGIVRPRAKNSEKVQPHYYHITGECTKESQIHWFCKHWMFESGSKFYINGKLYEVNGIEIEKTYETSFGKYKPDVTVHTNNGDVFFEMFFTNRKNSTDYFCKWNELNIPVVEVNLKEYMLKDSKDEVLHFEFLYNDGECYSEKYAEKDVYYKQLQRIKHEYSREDMMIIRRRIETLDKFWSIIDKSDEEILAYISTLSYDEIEECYRISSEKSCLKKLLGKITEIICKKIISDIKSEIDIEETENIYLDYNKHGKHLEIGIRLYIETADITHDELFSIDMITANNSIHKKEDISLDKNFYKKIKDSILTAESKIEKIKLLQKEIAEYNKDFLIKINNSKTTVLWLKDGKYELLIDKKYYGLSIKNISQKISDHIDKFHIQEEMDKYRNSDEYKNILNEIEAYSKKLDLDINIDLEVKNAAYNFEPKDYRMHYIIYNRGKYIGSTYIVSRIKKIILDRKKELDGYKYYVNELKNSPYFKVKEFIGKYGDPGIVISDINNISRKVIFIRQNSDSIYEIENKFTTAMKEIKEEVN